MGNSSDSIGNRTHDLPACSPVPPRTPVRQPKLIENVMTSRSMKQDIRCLEDAQEVGSKYGIFISHKIWRCEDGGL
jgi:hypothetical protein